MRKRFREPTEEDFDCIVGKCGSPMDTPWWCEIHGVGWQSESGLPCRWRLDFENNVKRLLQRLEQ